MKTEFEKQLAETIEFIASQQAKETKNKWHFLIDAIKDMAMKDFDYYVTYQLTSCIAASHISSAAAFIYQNYRYILRGFSQIIADKEGAACSVDKARYIVNGLYNKFEKNKPFTLDGDHFYISKTFTTESATAFYQALQLSFYGFHKELLKFY